MIESCLLGVNINIQFGCLVDLVELVSRIHVSQLAGVDVATQHTVMLGQPLLVNAEGGRFTGLWLLLWLLGFGNLLG